MSNLALVGIGQLVTLAGPKRPRTGAGMRDLGIIQDGAILVDDGRIEHIGTRQEIEPLIDARTTVIDAGGRVVLPGFVDAHTHPVFAGNRADEFERRTQGATYQEIADAGGGIRSTVRKTRAATEGRLTEAALRYADWFLAGGTTTIEAKSGYGLTLDDELKMLRVIRNLGQATPLRLVPTFLGAHEIPDEYRNNAAAYVRLIVEEMLPRVAHERLAEYCDVFAEPHIFPAAETRTILNAARALGLGLRIHADQLADSGGAQLAAELRATTADHLEHTSAEGIAALFKAGVQPVLVPASVYTLGSRQYPAARAMIDAGLPVVLATDFNPGSSPTTSMQMILSLACTHLRMTPAEAITAATINPAYSLERGAQIGSLEPGKRADIVIHDRADYREIPYFVGINSAWTVIARGVTVVRPDSARLEDALPPGVFQTPR